MHFQSESGDGHWRISWSDDHSRFDATLHGTVTFTDDLSDVQTLSDGGSLTIRDWSGLVPHTIEIRSAGGTLTRKYYVAGLERPWNGEARQLLATQITALVRKSGLAAESRVKSILEKKGVAGVLAEVDLLGGDYVRRRYLTLLVDMGRLDSTGVVPVIDRVARNMRSDYDRGQVLQRVAKNVTLDQRAASAYVQAVGSMKSDYERRRSLSALFNAAGQMADANALFIAVNDMRSSYDKRQVLDDLIGRGSLDNDMKQSILRAAAGINSDYDRGQVLQAYVKRFGVEPAVREPFFAAVSAIRSPYERRRVLTEVAKKEPSSREVQQAAFGVVATMSSDFDRAETLLAFISTQPMDAATRQAFVAAAERIRSAHDQNRVLAALVRAERR
jgi:hypothetical protein